MTTESTDTAIGQYSEVAAEILNALASKGLKRQELSSKVFYEKLSHIAISPAEFAEVFYDTAQWLRDEGYIRFEQTSFGTEDEECLYGCVPTSLCLAVLDKRIESLGDRSGREVLRANNSGEITASMWVKAGSLFGGLLGGFTKSIS
jgi:hypothetical protein